MFQDSIKSTAKTCFWIFKILDTTNQTWNFRKILLERLKLNKLLK